MVGADGDRLSDGQDGDRWVAAQCSGPPRVHAHGAGEGRGLRPGRCGSGDDATERHSQGARRRPRPDSPARGGQPPTSVPGLTHAHAQRGSAERSDFGRGIGRPKPYRRRHASAPARPSGGSPPDSPATASTAEDLGVPAAYRPSAARTNLTASHRIKRSAATACVPVSCPLTWPGTWQTWRCCTTLSTHLH